MNEKVPDYSLFLLRKNDINWTEVNRDVALINSDTCDFYTLNEVGGAIWKMADGSNSLSDIVQAVIDDYTVDKNTAEKDIWELANKLVDEKLAVFSKVKKQPA